MESDSLFSPSSTLGNRRPSTSPSVSIVVMSRDPEELLESRLASLRTRFDPAGTEYVVTWAGPGRGCADLKRRFPHIKLVAVPQSTTLADLRIQGIKAAAGDIVLLLQHNDSSDMPLSELPRPERQLDISQSAQWELAPGTARDRARLVSR